ncbi:MAG: biotin synthase BioB [Phycisphaeraceae bacterium]
MSPPSLPGSLTPPTAADDYARWAARAVADEPISREDALTILERDDPFDLLAIAQAAGQVRQHYFGRSVTIHVLDNVQNGACPEDCGYCGQSKDSTAPIQPYKLKSVDDIVAQAKAAQERGAYRFCMALSGRGPDQRDISHMTEAIRQIKAMGMRTCLSSGLLDDEKADQLAEAGLDRLNHNLNTSRRHYPDICKTHTYDDRVRTLASARQAGIGLCSGMIVGMNETHEDILDVAFALREVNAESIPVNFLLPIEGNRVNEPLSNGQPLTPAYVVRVLSMMRLVNPRAEIRVAAGREAHLRALQPLALWPANSLFMDGYLLTEGAGVDQTLRMIVEAGFAPAFDQPEALPARIRDYLENPAAAQASSPESSGTDGAVPELGTRLKAAVSRRG